MWRIAGFALAILLPVLALAADEKPAGGAATVDVALVLAVDSSSSVDADEFILQMEGFAAAFRDAQVIGAIGQGKSGAIAVSLIEWSNSGWQRVNIPWRTLRSEADAKALAEDISTASRLIYGGGTSISAAIDFAVRQFRTSNVNATRRVIDVSGDGANNQGRPLANARAAALAAGITINGLAIINEEPDLTEYYREQVIGGDGAFVLQAKNYEDFAEAMRTKLLREIGVPVSEISTGKQLAAR